MKDAAAMSIYGSRAANGVIMITTKSGRSGKTKYQIDSRYGIDFFPSNSKWEKLDPRDELILKREGVKNVGGNPDDRYPLSLLKKGGTDWIDLVMRDGKVQEHSFSARGGNEKTTFYSSLTYLNQEGIVNGSDLERASIRVNLDQIIYDGPWFVTFEQAEYQMSIDGELRIPININALPFDKPITVSLELTGDLQQGVDFTGENLKTVVFEPGEYSDTIILRGKNTYFKGKKTIGIKITEISEPSFSTTINMQTSVTVKVTPSF